MKKATLITTIGLGLILVSGQSAFAQISQEQAKQIAMQHAGINPAEAAMIKVTYEIDNGIPEYEIEFYKNNVEYDYTINANNGQILSQKQEIHNNVMPAQQAPAQQGFISIEKAQQIAMQHAGLSQGQIRNLRCYQEIEDGINVYKVKFWQEYTEYEYEIDAATGIIREFDKETN